jgi:hypothetical protein
MCPDQAAAQDQIEVTVTRQHVTAILFGNRYEIAEFGNEAPSLGVRCGAGPHHVRSLAEALCRRRPASRYSPDMSKHILVGTDERLYQDALEYARRNYRFPGRAAR